MMQSRSARATSTSTTHGELLVQRLWRMRAVLRAALIRDRTAYVMVEPQSHPRLPPPASHLRSLPRVAHCTVVRFTHLHTLRRPFVSSITFYLPPSSLVSRYAISVCNASACIVCSLMHPDRRVFQLLTTRAHAHPHPHPHPHPSNTLHQAEAGSYIQTQYAQHGDVGTAVLLPIPNYTAPTYTRGGTAEVIW